MIYKIVNDIAIDLLISFLSSRNNDFTLFSLLAEIEKNVKKLIINNEIAKLRIPIKKRTAPIWSFDKATIDSIRSIKKERAKKGPTTSSNIKQINNTSQGITELFPLALFLFFMASIIITKNCANIIHISNAIWYIEIFSPIFSASFFSLTCFYLIKAPSC
jgi:hypothetical protein